MIQVIRVKKHPAANCALMSNSNTVVGEKPLVKKKYSTNLNFFYLFFAKNLFGAAMSKTISLGVSENAFSALVPLHAAFV